MEDNIKNYSVIILTHLPHDELITSLEMLLNQSIKPTNIVIYNTDLIKFYNNIKNRLKFEELIYDNKNIIKLVHIKVEDFDHGKTRNDAIDIVNTDYVLYLTDDAVPYDKYLCENLLNAFDKYSDKEKVAVVYGRQIAKDSAKLKEKYVREFNYPDYDIVKDIDSEKKYGIKNYFCSNVCAMYDREIFYKLSKFEENIILNEDTFYVYKAINNGYKNVYVSDARVYHSHNYSYHEQFSRNFDIGVSQAERHEIFEKLPSYNEGKKLAKYVILRLLKGLHFIMIVDFVIECLYRVKGFRKGLNFKSLTNEQCIKYASNKNYFIKKEQAINNG